MKVWTAISVFVVKSNVSNELTLVHGPRVHRQPKPCATGEVPVYRDDLPRPVRCGDPVCKLMLNDHYATIAVVPTGDRGSHDVAVSNSVHRGQWIRRVVLSQVIWCPERATTIRAGHKARHRQVEAVCHLRVCHRRRHTDYQAAQRETEQAHQVALHRDLLPRPDPQGPPIGTAAGQHRSKRRGRSCLCLRAARIKYSACGCPPSWPLAKERGHPQPLRPWLPRAPQRRVKERNRGMVTAWVRPAPMRMPN